MTENEKKSMGGWRVNQKMTDQLHGDTTTPTLILLITLIFVVKFILSNNENVCLKQKCIISSHLEFVGGGSKTQLQVGK